MYAGKLVFAQVMEYAPWHTFREHELAGVHRYLPGKSGKVAQNRAPSSSR